MLRKCAHCEATTFLNRLLVRSEINLNEGDALILRILVSRQSKYNTE